MTRRDFIPALIAPAFAPASRTLAIPLLVLTNKFHRTPAARIGQFRTDVWNESFRVFAQCGITLRPEYRECEIRQHPGGNPRFMGTEPNRLNFILTDRIPSDWDNGRDSPGVAAQYEGHHLCLIAMNTAHPNRVPYLSVNTIVHELLHMFLQDILIARGGMVQGYGRETRADWYATRMWLFHEGTAVRESAREYLSGLAPKPHR